MKIAYALLALCVLFVICMPSSPAYACSCAAPKPANERVAQYDAVFTGKVIAKKEETSWALRARETNEAVLLEVDSVWKGLSESQVIVRTDLSSCQFDFQVGQSYLVYAGSWGGKPLSTHICSGSAELTAAAADLQALGSGAKPAKKVNLQSSFEPSLLLPILWLTAILAVLTAGAYWLLRVRSRRE
ncbi:hypothetical protein [Paenibacillus contaminans]|uniref:Tissue inhibitor of metalloproteinase n=1 Tax=Paenibacillus contaminans TaxID=450362 RepID=A0A329LXP9_9BACL|nr:hypothetical protein [Paenibacillus contaminans]RAV11906.1 hypothetical protein DQG23_35600 [Paenibacillus contaminans]